MAITEAIHSRFSTPVRQRGSNYARSGAVHLIAHEKGWAELDVDGSDTWPYTVRLERIKGDDYSMECSCPHFDDGYYCKHIWAAALVADEKQLFGPASTVEAAQRKRSKQADWKKQLAATSHRAPSNVWDDDADSTPRQVFYLLETAFGGETPTIDLYQRQLKEDGEWGKIKPLSLRFDTIRDFTAPEDRDVLALLFGNHVIDAHRGRTGYYDRSSSYNSNQPTQIEINQALYDTIFPALAETGRFVWLLAEEQGWDDARPISWDAGKAWQYRLHVKRADRNRKWQLRGELTRGKRVRSVGDVVQWYAAGLVLMDDTLARFEPPSDSRWVETLRANEYLDVPTSERDSLIAELWQHAQPPEIVGEPKLCLSSTRGVPVGQFRVHPPRDLPSYYKDRHLYASVGYRYGDHEASPNSTTNAWLLEHEGTMVLRDRGAEQALMNRLLELKLAPKEPSFYGDTPPGHLQFAPGKLEELVETLVAEGWIVEAEGARVRRGGGMSVSVRSGIDWFDLEGEVDFDGESVALPELLAAVQSGERYVQLGDGSRGLLPKNWLAQYVPLADLASSEQNGQLRFQTSQALLLDSLLSGRESELSVTVDRQFATWRKRLRSFEGVKPASPSRTFHGELRDYQQEGLGWLRFLEKFSFGGCLADDMGLGKTVQVLALLADRRRRQPRDTPGRPSLVIAPKSLIHNWCLEAERFAPRLKTADYTGIDRKQQVSDFADHDLVLTTYGTLRRDAAELGQVDWDYAILDEAQAIKNHASQSAKACRLLRARHRLALSGTPIENHLGELWSIFEFLNPGLLGKSKSFQKLHKGRGDREQHLSTIREGIAPFLLRRTKQQVLPQLPKKSEQSLYCELSATERKKYNQLRDHYRASLTRKIADSSLAKAKIHVLEALLRLRQAACHPGLIDQRQKKKPSTKLSLLIEQLGKVIEEGHKALVFSQFTTMLDIVRQQLDDHGVVYEYLDGKTRKRQQHIDRFQTDEACQAFLISLKAGGCGLNLTAADYVFLLDPWWNPAVEAQAIDRVHRIGQTRPVFAYRLIARDTVEEKILEMQGNKRELADAIVTENSSLLKSLSADDLQRLLS